MSAQTTGEPEVIGDLRWAAEADDDKAVMLTPVVVREILTAYDTAIAQRDAAVRERAECVAREQRWLARLAAQRASVDDDYGPNDGYARTVNRTPPQAAATTRGEG